MDPVAFRIFGIEIMWYAMLILAGVILGLIVARFNTSRRDLGLLFDDFLDAFLYAFPLAIVGARIYYVIFEWDNYRGNWAQILNIRGGGLAIHGGLIGALIGVLIYKLVKKKSAWYMLSLGDAAAPGLILAQAVGRWGNFMNQEAHGGPVTRQFLENLYLPEFIIEQMNINGTYYHPTFLYESLWSLLGFVLIVTIRNRKQILRQEEVALSYVLWYSVGRFFIEGMRTNSLWIGEWIRVSQALSLALFIGAIVVWFIRRQDYPPISYYSDGNKGQKKTIKMVN